MLCVGGEVGLVMRKCKHNAPTNVMPAGGGGGGEAGHRVGI